MKIHKILLIFASLPFFIHCASMRKSVEINGDNRAESAIQIQYGLGNNEYEIRMKGLAIGAELATFMNGARIELQKITDEKYLGYAEKVMNFADQQKPLSQQLELKACKSPYVIAIEVSDDRQVISGCRETSEKGSFGRLISEAEILLYSSGENQ